MRGKEGSLDSLIIIISLALISIPYSYQSLRICHFHTWVTAIGLDKVCVGWWCGGQRVLPLPPLWNEQRVAKMLAIPTLHTVFTSQLGCEWVDIVLSAAVCKIKNELQEQNPQHVFIQPIVEWGFHLNQPVYPCIYRTSSLWAKGAVISVVTPPCCYGDPVVILCQGYKVFTISTVCFHLSYSLFMVTL